MLQLLHYQVYLIKETIFKTIENLIFWLSDIQRMTDEHNLIEEDVIILAPPDEQPCVKGTPKSKQTSPQPTPPRSNFF